MMMNRPSQENGVSGTQTCEGATPVTESRVEQPHPCRNSNTARMKWTKEMNKVVMKCYIKSSPDRRGYRKRMMAIWSEEGICEIDEQRLACQARAIKTNGWLSAVEIEEIRRQIVVESNRENLGETNKPTMNETGSNGNGNANESSESTEERRNDESSDQCLTSSEEQVVILQLLVDELAKEGLPKPPCLRNVERSKLKKAVLEVNEVIQYIDTSSVTETNKLLMAGANVVYTRLGMKQRSSYSKTEPWWKKRIKRKIKQLRQDISRLERIRSDDLRNNTLTQSLKKKYNIARKGLNRVVEELKQRLTAQAAKLKRYEDRQTAKTGCLRQTRRDFLRRWKALKGTMILYQMLKKAGNYGMEFGGRGSSTMITLSG